MARKLLFSSPQRLLHAPLEANQNFGKPAGIIEFKVVGSEQSHPQLERPATRLIVMSVFVEATKDRICHLLSPSSSIAEWVTLKSFSGFLVEL